MNSFEREADSFSNALSAPDIKLSAISLGAASRVPRAKNPLQRAAVDTGLDTPGAAVPSSTSARVAPRLGADLSAVRIHRDPVARASADMLGARAYTVGSHIVLGSKFQDIDSGRGFATLAHELAHVGQQTGFSGDRAAPGPQFSLDGYLKAMNQKPEVDWTVAAEELEEVDIKTIKLMLKNLGSPQLIAKLHEGARVSPGVCSNVAQLTEPDYLKLHPTETRRVATECAASVTTTPAVPTTTPPTSPTKTTAPPEVTPVPNPGDPKVTLSTLPGYEQAGDTCGAASLVSALIIWDRDNRDADQNTGTTRKANPAVVSACNIILTYLANYRTKTIEAWKAKKIDGEAIYTEAVDNITRMRDTARHLGPGTNINELDYQLMSAVLYFLWVDGRGGLSTTAIGNIQNMLGLNSGRSETIQSFDEIFATSILTGLQAGRIAQIGWYVKQGKANAQGEVSLVHHAFLIGRLKDGKWFLSDQGSGNEFTASTLKDLQSTARAASSSGSYWLFTGSLSDLSMFTVGGWTGVKLLNARSAVENKDGAMIPAGTFLAEVDAPGVNTGESLYVGDFVSRHYSFSEVQLASGAASMLGFGRLIVEMPKGAFSLYKTNTVSDSNMMVKDIDHADSTGGLLTRREFYHVWLSLCNPTGCALALKLY